MIRVVQRANGSFLSKSILWVTEGKNSFYCSLWVPMGRGLAIPLAAFFRYMVLSHHTLAQGVLEHGLGLARSVAERLEKYQRDLLRRCFRSPGFPRAANFLS